MKDLRAIETRYHGCRFRSRLEARWAVFFDAFGAEWEYEPEGYDLGTFGAYLPDFVVAGRAIVEVKRPHYGGSEEEWDLWNLLVDLLAKDLSSEITTFILADGVPDANGVYRGLDTTTNPMIARYMLARCIACAAVGFARIDAEFDVCGGLLLCGHQDCELLDSHCGEILAATRARFEHGELATVSKIEGPPRKRRASSESWQRILLRSGVVHRPPGIDAYPELIELQQELEVAIGQMRQAQGREKCKFFQPVLDATRRRDSAYRLTQTGTGINTGAGT